MGLRDGIRALRHRPDPAPDLSTEGTKQYVTELNAAAQRAEMAGDSLKAEAAHNEINNELDRLR